jgi:hypothetical protein
MWHMGSEEVRKTKSAVLVFKKGDWEEERKMDYDGQVIETWEEKLCRGITEW